MADTFYHIDGYVLKMMKGLEDYELQTEMEDYQEKLARLQMAGIAQALEERGVGSDKVEEFLQNYFEYQADAMDAVEEGTDVLDIEGFEEKYPDFQKEYELLQTDEVRDYVDNIINAFNKSYYDEASQNMSAEAKQELNDYLLKLQAERQGVAQKLREDLAESEEEEGANAQQVDHGQESNSVGNAGTQGTQDATPVQSVGTQGTQNIQDQSDPNANGKAQAQSFTAPGQVEQSQGDEGVRVMEVPAENSSTDYLQETPVNRTYEAPQQLQSQAGISNSAKPEQAEIGQGEARQVPKEGEAAPVAGEQASVSDDQQERPVEQEIPDAGSHTAGQEASPALKSAGGEGRLPENQLPQSTSSSVQEMPAQRSQQAASDVSEVPQAPVQQAQDATSAAQLHQLDSDEAPEAKKPQDRDNNKSELRLQSANSVPPAPVDQYPPA